MQPLSRAWTTPNNINTGLQMLSCGVATCSADAELKGITSAIFTVVRMAICSAQLYQENTRLCSLVHKSGLSLTIARALFFHMVLSGQFDITHVEKGKEIGMFYQ